MPRLRELKRCLSEKKHGTRDNEVAKHVLSLVRKHRDGITWSPLVLEFWSEHAAYIPGRSNLNNHEPYYCLFYLSQQKLIEIVDQSGEEVFRPLKCVRENRPSVIPHIASAAHLSRCRICGGLQSKPTAKQPRQIVGHRRQRKLRRHLRSSSGAELPHSPLLLQHSEHRFHQSLSSRVYSSSPRHRRSKVQNRA